MEQERPRGESLAPVAIVVAAIIVAGLIAGRDGVILAGTALVVGITLWTGRATYEPSARRIRATPPPDDSELSAVLAPEPPLARSLLPPIALDAPAFAATATAEPIAMPESVVFAEPAASDMAIEASTGRAPVLAVPAIDWRAHAIPGEVLAKLATCLVAVFFAWFFLTDLGNNPAGLFCDEAEIGIRARQYLSWDLLRHGKFLLFYHHFAYTSMGSLPLLTTAPFVLVFGLSDFSVRMASMVCMAAAIPFLVGFVRRVGWRYGEAGVIAFAASPIYIHFARINFGQAPSILCVAIGLYCFATAKDHSGPRWPVLAGLAFGLSVYGNVAFYLSTPVILAALGIGEIAVNRLALRRYRDLAILAATVTVCWIPVAVRWLTDPDFMERFHEKTGTTSSPFSLDRLHAVVENYSRYFSLDYLFVKGEAGLPGGYNTRHSVPGAGELQYLLLPLVLFGIIGVFRLKDERTRLFGVMGIALLLLYPVPDAMATPSTSPPYSVTAFATMMFVPILAALGVHWLIGWLRTREISYVLRPRLCSGVLLGLALFAGASFFTGPYADYPNVSAGYYGWQYGPRQAIAYFKQYRNDYDRFQMDGDFNEAYIFLDFYMYGDRDLRQRTIIGGLMLAEISRHELMAVRAEKYNALMESTDRLRDYVKTVGIVYYPDGTIAMYILDVGAQNDTNRRDTFPH